MTHPDEEAPALPDLWLGGRLRLHQPPRGAHRAGTDAVLLASLIQARDGETLFDLGAGTGAVGLASVLQAPGCRLVLVERDPDLAALARANVALNGMTERGRVVVADLLASGAARRAAGLAGGSADIVLTNPPYFEKGRQRVSPHAGKAGAHGFMEGGLDRWLRACADLLKPGGRLGLIHRADALAACLKGVEGRFGAVCVRPVHARSEDAAIRILVTARKGSRALPTLRPALVLHAASGAFTPEAEALHRGEFA